MGECKLEFSCIVLYLLIICLCLILSLVVSFRSDVRLLFKQGGALTSFPLSPSKHIHQHTARVTSIFEVFLLESQWGFRLPTGILAYWSAWGARAPWAPRALVGPRRLAFPCGAGLVVVLFPCCVVDS